MYHTVVPYVEIENEGVFIKTALEESAKSETTKQIEVACNFSITTETESARIIDSLLKLGWI